MIIWGRLNSLNVQKVVWAAEELGLGYERRDAGGPYGVVETPDYLAMNPMGQVPVIEDEGFVLWESNAILRYLAGKHDPGGLWPADARTRADADRWMDWQSTEFYPALAPAFANLVRTPPESRDQGAIERSLERGERMAAILDAQLASRAYLAGETFTMGDIPAGCAAHRWLNLPAARQPRPHLQRWYEAIVRRPAAATVLTTPLT